MTEQGSNDEAMINRAKGRFVQQIRRIESGGREDVKIERQIGESFRRIREATGMGLEDLSLRIEEDIDTVSAFEHGFVPVKDLPEGFLGKYSGILVSRISGRRASRGKVE